LAEAGLLGRFVTCIFGHAHSDLNEKLSEGFAVDFAVFQIPGCVCQAASEALVTGLNIVRKQSGLMEYLIAQFGSAAIDVGLQALEALMGQIGCFLLRRGELALSIQPVVGFPLERIAQIAELTPMVFFQSVESAFQLRAKLNELAFETFLHELEAAIVIAHLAAEQNIAYLVDVTCACGRFRHHQTTISGKHFRRRNWIFLFWFLILGHATEPPFIAKPISLADDKAVK
jgi:hypothetical protein